MPKVSIIITTFNASRYIQQAIEAIRIQDYSDYEIIIVDDSSTDSTKEVVQSLNSDDIRYYFLEKNHGGPSLPRNIGIQMAKGQYVAFCDVDDIWLPCHLSKAVAALDSRESVAMVFTDADVINEANGQNLGRYLDKCKKFHGIIDSLTYNFVYLIPKQDAFSCLFYEQYILISGLVVRKSVFENVGLFDENLTNGDDRDMWFRISRCYPLSFIDEPGFVYRTHEGSISTRRSRLENNRIKVFRKQIRFGLPPDLYAQCLEMISKNYYSLGYCYQENLEFSKARENYLCSLFSSWNFEAFKGLAVTMLGKWCYLKLYKFAHGKKLWPLFIWCGFDVYTDQIHSK